MGDILVLSILGILCAWAIYYMWKNRGKSSCGGDCGACSSGCNLSEDLKKARVELAKQRNKN